MAKFHRAYKETEPQNCEFQDQDDHNELWVGLKEWVRNINKMNEQLGVWKYGKVCRTGAEIWSLLNVLVEAANVEVKIFPKRF